MDQPVLSPSSLLDIAKPALNAPATAPSPTSERNFKPKSKMSSLETVPESDPRIQSQHASSVMDAAKSTSSDEQRLSTKRSQYFHDALHERSSESSAAAAVENEQQFLTVFSHHLAARYNRYPSSIVISLHHSQCLLFGGSMDPAYTLTITALASEVQPATNKRNAAVLQKHLEAVLRVPPARGMVRFIPVAEESLAWGSKTVAGRISEAVAGDGDGEKERNKVQERRRLKALSLKRTSPANVASSNAQPQSLAQQAKNSSVNSTVQVEPTEMFGGEESVKVVRKKKSIIHTLFRTSKGIEDEEPSRS
ncbi:hypothetical protein N5P37_007865 [Trichoderma harzianum]|nr:hypothetical protein N5P37_007865 [Trichoderma harzianum]